MKTQFISKQGVVLDEDVYEVVAPTLSGRISIYDLHTPVITDVQTGVVSIRSSISSEPVLYPVKSGLLEITPHSVRILADEAGTLDSLAEEAALSAVAAAEELVKNAKDTISLEEARRQLSYSSLKLDLVKSKRRRK